MPRPDLFERDTNSWQFAPEASRLIATAVRPGQNQPFECATITWGTTVNNRNNVILFQSCAATCSVYCVSCVLSNVTLTYEAKSSMIPYMQDTTLIMRVYLGMPIDSTEIAIPSYVCVCGVG